MIRNWIAADPFSLATIVGLNITTRTNFYVSDQHYFAESTHFPRRVVMLRPTMVASENGSVADHVMIQKLMHRYIQPLRYPTLEI
jgi:hypothetical protein